ncbi:hypothetical protein RHECNPAF_6420019 [Rhizobium etli CNPAF512]|nr:hypothetical protein RHECNPAF_6420019 [Rhizobium etli CNPAF512]
MFIVVLYCSVLNSLLDSHYGKFCA